MVITARSIACLSFALSILGDTLLTFGASIVPSSVCNNVEGLCHVPVDEVLFGMVHNAMSSPSAGFYFFANHMNDPIVESLDEGYRGLSLDLCNCDGDLIFCHGGTEVGCGIGERDPLEAFTEINEWITENPNNVIMVWLQINENAGDPISLDDVEQLVIETPIGTADRKFVERLHRREEGDDWPTLSKLIENEQQILFFYMGGPDGREESSIGIHYFYDYGMSTDWSYATVSDLKESVLDGCKIQRDSSGTRDFFMINTFITKKVFGIQVRPSRDAAEEVNDGKFLQPLLDVCEYTHKSKVNIISVDFWKSGDLISFIVDENSKRVTEKSTEDLVPTLDNSPSGLPSSSEPSSDSGRTPIDSESLKTQAPSSNTNGNITSSNIPTADVPWSDFEKPRFNGGYNRNTERGIQPEKRSVPVNKLKPRNTTDSTGYLDDSMRTPTTPNPEPVSSQLSSDENKGMDIESAASIVPISSVVLLLSLAIIPFVISVV